MELFLSFLTAFLIQGIKWISNKLGAETTKWIIYGLVLVISGIWTYLKVSGILTQEFLNQLIQNISVAIATYEVVIKWILGQGIIPGTQTLIGKLKK